MRIKLILITYLFIFACQGSLAQPEMKVIGRITSGNGLLTDGIKYTFKDSQGFMWFTFETGFQRWDGSKVKNYSYLTDTTLNQSYRFCRPILEDKKGNFFIGTLHNGLIKLNRKTDTYTRYQHDPADVENSMIGHGVHEMMLDSAGIIWLGTIEGLTRFNPTEETFENYIINPEERYDPRNSSKSIVRDSKGILWVGTGNGLYKLNEIENRLEQVITDPVIPGYLNSFECILEDKNGIMWFGTLGGILKYDRESENWEHIPTTNPDKPDSDVDGKVKCMLEYQNDKIHQLWIGTFAGLKVYDMLNGEMYHLTPRNGYPEIANAGVVQYLYLDENDILWASLGGITLIDLKGNAFDIQRIKSYPDSLYDERAFCFYEDSAQNIWVGTQKNGAYQFDQDLNFIANYKACDWTPEESYASFNNLVWRIYEDPYDRIWMNTGPTCLSIFEMGRDTFHPIDVDVGSYTAGRLIIDPYDIVWLTAHDGLHKGSMRGEYDLQVSLYENPTLPKTPIDRILYDSHDRMWIITRSSGVFCLHPEDRDSMIFTPYLHKNYRHSFTIQYNAREMCEDPDGNIWFISLRELFKYDPQLDSIIPDDYFNDNFKGEIHSIIRDNNGVIWMGIKVGMLAYRYSADSFGGIQVIDYRSGLPFTFLTRGPFFQDSRGYIYQGGQMTTERGFFRFHPDSILGPNSNLPPVVLTSFKVKNNAFPLDSNITHKKDITLSHKQNFFSFEFSALDYRGPEKNQYAYMLVDYDEDWTYSGNRRIAYYTGVPPGHYTFRVKASNHDGYWNEKGAHVEIYIAPPPWKSWWAYSLYGISLIILFVVWRRYDLKRHRLKQALELEQVEAEKLKELDSMKSRFFANISHEFRTPLTLIMGPLEKLIGTTKDEECVHDLNMMQRNARRLQRLINQLLNLSKLEAGEMKIIAGERNIIGLVRGYVHSFESLAKQKNIQLEFSSDEEHTLIYVDNDKIEKILYNLLSNAFKFTPEGGEIKVSVVTHPVKTVYKEDSSQGVQIIITDTGPGIPPDKVKHIFNRFYQADNASSGDQEGTGIGLALTQELVKLHHGDINVDSKIGKGTSFTITLPKGNAHLKEDEIMARFDQEDHFKEILPGEVPLKIDTKQAETPVAEESDQSQLLIVEDNDDLRTYIRSYLQDDYMIHEAIDGAHGLEMAIDLVPDLVVSDVMMPRMDGYELSRKLKSDERCSHIPVILLTAKAAKEDKIEGLETGADDFLTKPFDPAELQVRIRNLIEQRKSLREHFLREIKLSPHTDREEISSMDEQFLRKAVNEVGKNITDAEFSVEQFGKNLGMSRMQLHRKITALTGQAAGEFIRNLRLHRAAELIRNKAGNIAEIAYDTGFSSPSYFTDCFKKYFGKSPSEYQKDS